MAMSHVLLWIVVGDEQGVQCRTTCSKTKVYNNSSVQDMLEKHKCFNWNIIVTNLIMYA